MFFGVLVLIIPRLLRATSAAMKSWDVGTRLLYLVIEATACSIRSTGSRIEIMYGIFIVTLNRTYCSRAPCGIEVQLGRSTGALKI
jgi:hypothetical protein